MIGVAVHPMSRPRAWLSMARNDVVYGPVSSPSHVWLYTTSRSTSMPLRCSSRIMVLSSRAATAAPLPVPKRDMGAKNDMVE